MRRLRLFWRIYATYLMLVVLCALALGFFAASSARSFYRSHAQTGLQAMAALVAEQVRPMLGEASARSLDALVKQLGAASGTRLTLIATGAQEGAAGVVLADSEVAPSEMANHSDRPEFRAAAQGGVGSATRFSTTLNEDEMYVAVPVTVGGEVVAVSRASMLLSEIGDALGALYWRIVAGTLIVAVIAALIGLWVSSRISRQMREVTAGTKRFAAGDFTAKLPVPRTVEFAAVAEGLNSMAERLDQEIRTLTRERNEREAVLASMIEGVLAVDDEERVLAMNEASAKLLGVARKASVGRSIQEVVRNPELQRLVADTLAGRGPVEREILLRVGADDRTLQANGALLQTDDEAAYGAVVVLNDVTRLKRLEEVRSDFVASVSHELKTPVTSIKGFTETLLDGAADDARTARRFLRIVDGHADRLNAIIEDLLDLSMLEAAEAGPPALDEADIRDVVHVAAEVCSVKAAAKSIDIVVSCPEPVIALVNPPLLEHAVVNLIDNAVKYSPDGSEVEILLRRTLADAEIVVRDHGPGIARQHLPRLFERFYRVDKARSRDMGGTGLGLAIVKHIMQAHGGSVSVESEVGSGSTFTLHLPVERA